MAFGQEKCFFIHSMSPTLCSLDRVYFYALRVWGCTYSCVVYDKPDCLCQEFNWARRESWVVRCWLADWSSLWKTKELITVMAHTSKSLKADHLHLLHCPCGIAHCSSVRCSSMDLRVFLPMKEPNERLWQFYGPWRGGWGQRGGRAGGRDALGIESGGERVFKLPCSSP